MPLSPALRERAPRPRPRVESLVSHLLRRGTPLRIRARGGSMIPFLLDGDVVVIEPAAAADVRVGDVICYEPWPGRLFVHRVVARTADGLVAKGDALTYSETVPDAALLGRVTGVERGARARRLDTPLARALNRTVAGVSPVLSGVLPVALWAWRRIRTVWRA
jgi:hypothetical protein